MALPARLWPSPCSIWSGRAESEPAWACWITPVRVAYITFALLTWLASPLFNLVLFLHPVGRHALNADQRWQARCVGLGFGLGLGALGLWLGVGRDSRFLIAALVFGLLALPAAAVFDRARGWPRWVMAGIATFLLATGLKSVGVICLMNPPAKSTLGSIGMGASPHSGSPTS